MDRIHSLKGRRAPGVYRPPVPTVYHTPVVPHPPSSSFPPPNPTASTNGTPNSQAGFLFGQPSNGISQSFNQPTSTNTFSPASNGSTNFFGGSIQNPFSAQFIPPSSSFDFNSAPTVKNPFTNDPVNGNNRPTTGLMEGYQGSIFSIPGYAPGLSNNSVAPPEAPASTFKFGPSQGDPAKTQSDIFSTTTGLEFGPEKSSTSSQNPIGGKANIFGQPKVSSSLFNQNSPFPSSQPHSQQPFSNPFGQSNAQKAAGSAITITPTAPTPTPTEAPQSQAFALQYEESMSTSPDHSPQAKGQGYSAPFSYPNLAPLSSSNGSSDSHALGDSLFSRISQPAATTTVTPAPVPESSQGDNQNSSSRNDQVPKPLFSLPPAPPEAKARSPEASPTKSGKQIAAPNFAQPRLEEAKSATSNLFASIKLPPPTQPSISRAESGPKSTFTLSNTPSQSSSAARFPEKERLGSSDASSLHDLIQKSPLNGFCWFRAPPPPENLSDEEQRQVIIGYQLKCLDAGVNNFLETRSIEKDSATAERFYGKMKQDILDGKGLVLDPLAGSKRRHQNSELEEEHQEEANNKRARVHPPAPSASAKPAEKTSSGAFAPNSFPKPSGGLFSQSTTVNSLLTPKSSAKPSGGFSTSNLSAKPSATFAAPNSSAKPASGFSFTSGSAANPSAFSFTPNPASTPSSTPTPVATPAQLAAGAKRKALEDHDKSKVEGANNSVKRARAQDPISYPSLSSSTGSQTSSIFKNILDKMGEEASPSAGEPLMPNSKAAGFDFNSTNTLTPIGSNQEQASTKVSNNGAHDSSIISLSGSSSHTPRASKPLANFSRSPSSTPTTANPFSSVTATSTGLFSNKTPPAVSSSSVSSSHSSQTPSIINNMASDKLPQLVSSTSASSNHNPSNANARPSHPDKPSTSFAPPKFGAPVNFLSQFGKAAEKTAEKEKKNRKAEDFDSDEDNEEDWERNYDEEQKAKKQKLEEAAKATATKFIPGVGFKFEKPEKKEEPETSQPSGSIASSSITATPATSNISIFTKPRQTSNKQQNIFAHLSDVDSGQDGSKIGDADDEDEDEDEDSASDQNAGHAAPPEDPKAGTTSESALKPNAGAANPFAASSALFTKKLAEKTDKSPPTGSLFDGISKPDETKPIINPFTTSEKVDYSEKLSTTPNKSNPFRQSQGLGSSIFGKPTSSGSGAPLFGESSPSFSFGSGAFGKASPTAPVAPMFGSNRSPLGDNTWKVDSPIKFANSDNPELKVTSPSPSKSPLGGLFGSPTANTTTEPSVKPTGIFSPTPAKDPSGGFGFAFGGPPKLTPANLALPSGLASNNTSRATSPGATTGGESAAESNAGEDKDETTKDPQLDLTAAGPGEEHEDVLITVKAKAMIYTAEKKHWLSKGVGMLRVLKHRDSKKTRILMRQDPSGKIVLNAALVSTLKYEHSPPKAVKMAIPTDTGKLSTWLIRVGKDEDAIELAKILEVEKKN